MAVLLWGRRTWHRLAWGTLLCLAVTAAGQQPKEFSDLDKCNMVSKALYRLSVNHAAKIDQLQQENAALRTKNEQWQAWYDENWLPAKAENDRLSNVNREIKFRVGLAFAAIGFGLFLAFLVGRGVRRVWPLSFEHKQLAVLVMVGVWVSVAALVAVSDSRFSYHPVSSAFGVGVWSLPALVFGAVAFWWFGKKHPRRLF